MSYLYVMNVPDKLCRIPYTTVSAYAVKMLIGRWRFNGNILFYVLSMLSFAETVWRTQLTTYATSSSDIFGYSGRVMIVS